MMGDTAVVLVNYKGASDTAKCVQSLMASHVRPRLVVVDNTPSDPNLEAAVSIFPDAKIIRAPENVGFGAGNNLGIEWLLYNSQCKYIFILNNDATVAPDTIIRLERVLADDPEIGMVAPRIVYSEDPDRLWYGGGYIAWYRAGGKVPGVDGPSDSAEAMQARDVEFASGCAMLLRRKVLESVGFFDDRFFMYEEDVNLCLRVRQRHWRIRYEPTALVYHDRQGSMRDSDTQYVAPLSAHNPNLHFYISNILCNKVINGLEYARGLDRLVFYAGFPLYITRLLLSFLRAGKWSAIKAVLVALSAGYNKAKK